MKAVVYINENDFWLDVMGELSRRNIEVSVIFGSPAGCGDFEEKVKRHFPNAEYRDHYAAIRGEFSDPEFASHEMQFDKAASDLWLEEGHLLMDLFGRIDVQDDFSYRDRRDLLRKYLKYADYLDRKYNLNLMVTSIFPHDPFLYTLFRLLHRRGKKLSTMTASGIDGRFYLWSDESRIEPRYDLVRKYNELLAEQRTAARLPAPLVSEFERMRKRTTEARSADSTYYTAWAVGLGTAQLFKKFKSFCEMLAVDIAEGLKLKHPVSVPYPTRYEKETGVDVDRSFRGFMPRMRHEFWAVGYRQRTRRLNRAYRNYLSPFSTDKPFVFAPLHYQPEMTTNPLGGAFFDLTLYLETLSAALPSDWQILVKEHPFQLNAWNQIGCRGRRPKDYEQMAAIPKVKLISEKENHYELLYSENCKAVATVTGTVGWEALMRGKPVLVFGDAWYAACYGAFKVSNVESCKAAVAAIQGGATGDPLKADLFAEAIDAVGVPAYVGEDGDWMPWVVTGVKEPERENTVQRYADLLMASLWPSGAPGAKPGR